MQFAFAATTDFRSLIMSLHSPAIQIKLREFSCALARDVELFDEVLVRISDAFDLFALQSQCLGDHRICAIFGDQEVGDDRTLLPVTRDSSDALLVHAGTPIQFAEDD